MDGDSKLGVITVPSYMLSVPERTANLFSDGQPCTYTLRTFWFGVFMPKLKVKKTGETAAIMFHIE